MRFIATRFIATLFLVFVSASAFAQKDPVGEPGNELNGHYFLPSISARQPFITSQMLFGLGVITGGYPGEILGRSKDINLAGIGPVIAYQGAVTHWLALNVGLSGNAIVGTDVASVLDYGGSTTILARIGAVAKLLDTESFILSFGFTTTRAETVSPSPSQVLRRAISNAISGQNGPLIDETVRIIWYPDLRAAWTISPIFGLSGSIGTASTSKDINDISSNATEFIGELALDVNFEPMIYVPVGAKLNYERHDPFSGNGGTSTLVSLGVYETYSKRFNFGAEVGRMDAPNFDATSIVLLTRYTY